MTTLALATSLAALTGHDTDDWTAALCRVPADVDLDRLAPRLAELGATMRPDAAVAASCQVLVRDGVR